MPIIWSTRPVLTNKKVSVPSRPSAWRSVTPWSRRRITGRMSSPRLSKTVPRLLPHVQEYWQRETKRPIGAAVTVPPPGPAAPPPVPPVVEPLVQPELPAAPPVQPVAPPYQKRLFLEAVKRRRWRLPPAEPSRVSPAPEPRPAPRSPEGVVYIAVNSVAKSGPRIGVRPTRANLVRMLKEELKN